MTNDHLLLLIIPLNFIGFYHFPLNALDISYHHCGVLLSIAIMVLSSLSTFGASERAASASNMRYTLLWRGLAATCMGVGICSTHFIGLLALQLPIPRNYDLNQVALSAIPMIFVSYIICWLMQRPDFNRLLTLAISSILFGGAFATMYTMDIAAMKINADIVHFTPLIILSSIMALLCVPIAFQTRFAIILKNDYAFASKTQVINSIFMGLAVAGVHYTAMLGTVFIPTDKKGPAIEDIDIFSLAGDVSLVAFIIMLMTSIIPHIFRFREMIDVLQKNEDNLKISATAFETHESIIVTDEHLKIIRVNKAFTRSTGYKEMDVIGSDLKEFNAEDNDTIFYNTLWESLKNKGNWSGKVNSRRKNGDVVSEWQSVSAVKNNDGEISNYVAFLSDIKEFKIAEKEIEKLAFYDYLTGLPNRRLLYERLAHELNLARRYQRAGVILFLDLDNFKTINDSLDHSIGDQLLVETAKRLQSLLRDTDTAARLGGDEFIILGSAQDGIHFDLTEQSHVLAEKVIQALLQPYYIGEHELYISASIGITLYTGIDETVELLLKKADTAMYQAKENGRNTYRFYQDSMQEAADARLDIDKNLRLAVSNNELELCYQAQHTDKETITGVEALLRWHSKALGDMSKTEFIAIAEESNLILVVGQWVLETACKQIKQWEKDDIQIPHISINISAKQFHQVDFVSNIIHTASEYHVDPKKLILEITESVFLNNLEEAIDKMHILKGKGFKFAIDDFGTGYSSLTYLKRLPFDQLKIDQSFVKELINRPTDVVIVKAIISMAKGLNLDIIAEGIETKEHFDFLSFFGCPCYQGFYFSKPLFIEEFNQYVKTRVVNKD